MVARGAPDHGRFMHKNKTKKRLHVSSESVAMLTAAGLRLVAGAGSDACTTEGNKSQCLWGCATGSPC